jgi:[citrate (pro-3S)-lyase] ligase
MKALLPEYGVQVIEIERKSDALGPISASRVRTLLEQGDTAELAALLPSAVLRDILR